MRMWCCAPKRLYTARIQRSPYVPPPFRIPIRYRILSSEYPAFFEDAYRYDVIGNLWLQQLLHKTISGYIAERPITQRSVIIESDDYIGQFLILGNKTEDTLILKMRSF